MIQGSEPQSLVLYLHQIAAEYPDSMYFPLRTTLGTLDELMGRQSSPESAGDCAAAKAKAEALLARVSTDVMQAFVHSLEECVVVSCESPRTDSWVTCSLSEPFLRIKDMVKRLHSRFGRAGIAPLDDPDWMNLHSFIFMERAALPAHKVSSDDCGAYVVR